MAVGALLMSWGLPASSAYAQSEQSIELALSIDGSGVDCSANECIVDKGSDFTLTVSVTSAPDAGYIGLGTQVRYQNLIYTPTETAGDEVVIAVDNFPGILVRAPADPAVGGVVQHGMTGGNPPSFTTSHYEGPIVELAMTCTDDYSRNDVELPPYGPDNILGSGAKLPTSAGGLTLPASDSLLIHCGPPPTATPVPPGPTATAAPGLPTTGTGAGSSSQTAIWFALGGLLAAAAVASVGVLSWKQARR